MERIEFRDLLRLIDERSAAFRTAVASASSLDLQVPSCPEWTLFDLVQHLGEGRQSWAATVAAGPDATEKAPSDTPPPSRDLDELLAWHAESTQRLVDALAEAGGDRGVWAKWGDTQTPLICYSVARRQVQEVAIHTYDAQLTAGDPQPLPHDVALDGVEDFLFTAISTDVPWPHEPATIEYRVAEGRVWRVRFDEKGAFGTRLSGDEILDPADMTVEGTSSDLILWMAGRLDVETDLVKVGGDRTILDRLIAWEP